MSNPIALVVDDEPDIRELLEITLSRMDISVVSAADVRQAKSELSKQSFDLCLTDMKLPDGDGLELVTDIQQHYPNTPVAVITAHGSMDSAVTALKKGAFDFVSKPVDLKVLRKLVTAALKVCSFPGKDLRSRHILLGESEVMREIRSKIAKLARSQAPIYIGGESGTGKELVAKLIHQKGPRSEKPFIAVNCGAIPHDLIESEFFGHKKGSFTGATNDKIGLFQAAEGGTLFLDEVADLPQSVQVKLLRAIQEKSVRPVGEQQEVSVDVRILSATHRNLAHMVQNGEFRQDLFYRINVIGLTVPPLRERSNDISLLTGHILTKLAESTTQQQLPTLSDTALAALLKYDFPGNVRELENILERATALCENDRIEEEDLQLPITAVDLPTQSTTPLPDNLSLESYMENIEKQAITHALEKTRWNKTAAAKVLGITFRALRYRLKKLEME
ncbi:MAG: sigma-54 dependent transcriptional regulator [Methylococcales bacterium]